MDNHDENDSHHHNNNSNTIALGDDIGEEIDHIPEISPSATTVVMEGEETQQERKITPLPKLPMIMISMIIIAEAVGYALLYPVVPFMIRDFLVYEHQANNMGGSGALLNQTMMIGQTTTTSFIPNIGLKFLYPISTMGNNFEKDFIERYSILNHNFTNATFGNHTNDNFEIQEETVGLMIGALSSAFSFAQLISNWFIARASDHVGRKPFLLSGLIFNIIFMSIFSVSKSFWFAFAIRIFHGLLNANIPIYKSFLMDITDDTNQEKAFVIISILWAVSNITTPGVGGFLVNFAEKFPVLFGGNQSPIYKFFDANPFILPFSIPVLMNIVTLILSIFLLKESLTHRFNILNWIKNKLSTRKKQKQLEEVSVTVEEELVEHETTHNQNQAIIGDESEDKLIKQSEGQQQDKKATNSQNSMLFLLKDSTVVKVVSLYLILGIFTNMADELVPIFFSNSVKKRGLGLDSLVIGLILSVGGVTSLVMLVIYPKLSKKFGFLWLYRIGLVIYGITMLILPFSTEMIRFDVVFWFVMGFVTFFIFIKSCIQSIIYTSQFLMINNASPSPEHIGSMNGLGHLCASIGWAIGPFACGLLVDLGLKFTSYIEEAVAPNSFFVKVPFVDKLSFVVCA